MFFCPLFTNLLRSKTQPCQHRCSFRGGFWAGMMAVALGTLMMKLGFSICQGSQRMKGKASRATCLQPLQMGRSEITSFVLHNFSIFWGKKTLCHTQEQHGRRWSLAFFLAPKDSVRQDQGYDSPQKDPTSKFLRTAVKAFNRKALDVPETMPRGGLENVESSQQKSHWNHSNLGFPLAGASPTSGSSSNPGWTGGAKSVWQFFGVVFRERKRPLRSFSFWSTGIHIVLALCAQKTDVNVPRGALVISQVLRCRSLDHAMQQCRASKKMNPHPIEYKPLIKSDPFFCKSWYFNLILIMANQPTPAWGTFPRKK